MAKRTAKFIISAENKTAGTISKITGDVGKLGGAFQRMGKLVGPALATLATGAAIKGFASMIQRANDLTDSLRDSSIRLGIGVSDLQAYQLAAGNAGIEAGKLSDLLGKLNKAAGEIKLGQGSDKTIAAFDALGISVAEVQKSNPAELFEKTIEGLGGIEDPATRAALAMQVFGKSGQVALTLVADGAKALEESRKFIADYGLTLTDIDASNVDAANDALGTLGKVAEFAKQKLGAELAPLIANLGNDLLEAGRKGGGFGEMIESGAGSAVEGLSRVIEGALAVGNAFSAGFNLVQGIVSNAAAAVLGFASDFVTAIGTTAPNAFNALLEATETGLTKMNQGFADFAIAAANVVVAGMNIAIKAIDALVNSAAKGISEFLKMANMVPGVNLGSFSYSQQSEQISGFDRFPVDRVNLGRVGTFGQGAAQSLGDYSSAYGQSGQEQFNDADTDIRQTGQALDNLFSADGGRLNQTFKEVTDSANKLTGVIDPASVPGGGGGGDGKGGTTGAMDNLKKKTEEAGSAIGDTFRILDEYGKSVTSNIEGAIDDFVKNGELSMKEFARSIIADLAAITAKAAILGGILGNSQYGGNGQGLVGTALSAIFSGGYNTTGAPKAIPVSTYAGGGFTGMGARSGGIDGKGGFPAILHPNETVLDHTKGQEMGGSVTIQQTVIVRETLPSGIAAQIVKSATNSAKAAMKEISDRGGNRRRGYRFA